MSEISIRVSDDVTIAGIEVDGEITVEEITEAILKYLNSTGVSYDSN